MLYGQPEVKAKAGGKAKRGLPVTSSSRVSDCDGRPPGAAAAKKAEEASQPALLNRVPFGKFNGVNCLKKDTHAH